MIIWLHISLGFCTGLGGFSLSHLIIAQSTGVQAGLNHGVDWRSSCYIISYVVDWRSSWFICKQSVVSVRDPGGKQGKYSSISVLFTTISLVFKYICTSKRNSLITCKQGVVSVQGPGSEWPYIPLIRWVPFAWSGQPQRS